MEKAKIKREAASTVPLQQMQLKKGIACSSRVADGQDCNPMC